MTYHNVEIVFDEEIHIIYAVFFEHGRRFDTYKILKK